jgi:hypothetical protein
MTAPRACRRCGADLAPDVRWCTFCFTPITPFAERNLASDGFVGTPHPDVRSSRWRGGPLTFGPVGRVLITVLVILMGPSTISLFSLLYMPVWLGLSIVVLKQVWRREPLDPDAPATVSDRFRARHPILGHRFDGTRIAFAFGAILLVAVGVLMLRADTTGFYLLVGLLAIVGLGAFIVWIADA